MIVWSDGGCQLEKTGIQLFSLPKFNPDLASAYPLCRQVALPRAASDEHCVSARKNRYRAAANKQREDVR